MKRWLSALAGLMLALASCENPISAQDSQPRVELELANGTVFTFSTANFGQSQLAAEHTFALSDSQAVAVTVTALTAKAVPYDAITVELVPDQITPVGTLVSASLWIKMSTFAASTASVPIDANYKPKNRVFLIGASEGLRASMYRFPVGKGVMTVDWSTEDTVLPVEDQTDYIYKSYGIKRIHVVAPTQR